MSLPFWFHCNGCGEDEYRPEDKFYLLSCQHILCLECLRKTGEGKKCPIDNQVIQHIDVRKLSSKMKRIFEPAAAQFTELRDTLKFQQTQHSSFVKFERIFDEKNKRADQQLAKIKATHEAKAAEADKLIERRFKMQDKLKEISEKNDKKNPEMQHRQSAREQTPSSAHSSKSPSSPSFFSTPGVVRPVYGYTPSSGESTVRSAAGFFDQEGPFMKKVQEYSSLYTQKDSQKQHDTSRKPFFS